MGFRRRRKAFWTAAAQALLAAHLGCPTRPPQTAASLLAQPEQRHCYYTSCYLLLVVLPVANGLSNLVMLLGLLLSALL